MTKHDTIKFDWSKAVRAGVELAKDQVRRDRVIGERDVMWALLCEAAQTSSLAFKGTPRLGFPSKSAMPDAPDEISYWAQLTAYLQGQVEDMPVEASRPPQPTAEQVSRAHVILDVWHAHALKDIGNWRRTKKAVYLKACGVKDRKVRSVTGMTKQQISKAKLRAMDEMLYAIRTY